MQTVRAITNWRAGLGYFLLLVDSLVGLSNANIISSKNDVIISYTNRTNNVNDGLIVPDDRIGKSGRIVGGSFAPISNFPYQLSLRFKGQHSCGASVLNANHALTAAHCIVDSNAADWQVYAGSADRTSGGVLHEVEAIGYHANYNPDTVQNDVGYIKVRTPFRLSDAIKPIGLPTEELQAGTMVTVAGWGQTRFKIMGLPRRLRSVTTPSIDLQQCNNIMKSQLVVAGMVCALSPGKGTCMGDSGGPLVSNGIQYGIVSWGRVDSKGNCNTKYPSVFADVYFYKDWINRYTSI